MFVAFWGTWSALSRIFTGMGGYHVVQNAKQNARSVAMQRSGGAPAGWGPHAAGNVARTPASGGSPRGVTRAANTIARSAGGREPTLPYPMRARSHAPMSAIC